MDKQMEQNTAFVLSPCPDAIVLLPLEPPPPPASSIAFLTGPWTVHRCSLREMRRVIDPVLVFLVWYAVAAVYCGL